MEIIGKLENEIGGRWIGVSLHPESIERRPEYISPHVDRFCEALKIAAVSKVLIDPHHFNCPGARYAFGIENDPKATMTRKLFLTKGYKAAFTERVIEKTPHCHDEIHAIGFNTDMEPGMYIAKLQPEQVMHLIQIYQERLEKVFITEMSSVISACGNVVVKTIQTQDMAISFGCDDSRAFGNLARDRLYAGLPYELAKTMMCLNNTGS